MGLTRLRYGRLPPQVVEAHAPDAPGPHPVCVLVHGGFWRAGYTLDLMRPLAADLAARGWLAWNVEFRRLGPLSRGGYPRTTDDVRRAIDLLAGYPEVADVRTVVAVGHSAGGHLALLAAATPGRVRLTGIVSQGGVCDLAEAHRLRLSDDSAGRFARGDPGADPMRHLPTGVPTLLVHGTEDPNVPCELSRRYAAAARAGGDRVDLDLRPGEGHFEHLDPASGAWASALAWIEQARAA